MLQFIETETNILDAIFQKVDSIVTVAPNTMPDMWLINILAEETTLI